MYRQWNWYLSSIYSFLRLEHYCLPKVISLKMNTTLKEKWLYFLPSWRVKEKKSLPSIFFPVITPHIAVLQRGVKYPVLIAFFFFYKTDIQWMIYRLPILSMVLLESSKVSLWVMKAKLGIYIKKGKMHDSC